MTEIEVEDEHDDDEHDDILIVGSARTLRRWKVGSTEFFAIDLGGGNVRRYRALDVDRLGSNAWTTTRKK